MHSLYVFCHIRAKAVEGQRLFDLAVNRFEHDDSAMLAYVLLARISLAGYNGRVVGAEQFPRAIQLAYKFSTDDAIAILLSVYLSIRKELIANKLFDDQRFEQVCHDFLDRFTVRDQPWGATFVLLYLGKNSHLLKGQLDEAEGYYRASRDRFLQLGDRWASCWSNLGLAYVSASSQKYREALQWWQEHQDGCAEVGDQGGVVHAFAEKARVTWKLQDHAAARFYIAQGIQSHLEHGSQFSHLDDVFRSFIDLLVSEDRHEQAAELLSFLRQHADQARASEVAAEAEQTLATLAERLPLDTYQQAIARGKALHLGTILEQLLDELSGYSPPVEMPNSSDGSLAC